MANYQLEEINAGLAMLIFFSRSLNDSTHVLMMHQHLIALDSILFDHLKLPFKFSLTLQSLLSPTNIDYFSIDLLPVHFINCLREQEEHRAYILYKLITVQVI